MRSGVPKRTLRRSIAPGGTAVADAEGHGVVVPIRGSRTAVRTAVAPLSGDTVAQIVWFLHKSQIQINSALPRRLHAAVAQHVAEHHMHECIARACGQARVWLREIPTPVEVLTTRLA